MYCICCNKNIYPITYSGVSDKTSIIKEDSKLWPNDHTKYDSRGENIVIDGAINNINISFGSKFDTSNILIAICDDCIEDKIDKGILLYGNGSDQPNIERSKKIYRRQKNINNLL